MSAPTLCILNETIGPYNAIGRVAHSQAVAAIAAGWSVSVVAKRLHESLRGRVEWLELYAPPRGFALQWMTGRYFIRQAIGGREFDVVHGHQPQIADLCNVYQCHFLTRVAHERACLVDGRGLRRGIDAVQKRIVLHAEDYFYRRWSPDTMMLFNSALTRAEFGRLYGFPPLHDVLIYPSPRWRPVGLDERVSARRRLLGRDPGGIVAGFLGGLHERKGYRRLISALAGQMDIVLLMGGLHSDGFDPAELAGHFRSVGLCKDTHEFYAACDVLLVPSVFEPFGYVISEALARGVPVIGTPDVGAMPHVLECGAGLCWAPGDSLPNHIRHVAAHPAEFKHGCERYTERHSPVVHDDTLFGVYEDALARKAATGRSVLTVGAGRTR